MGGPHETWHNKNESNQVSAIPDMVNIETGILQMKNWNIKDKNWNHTNEVLNIKHEKWNHKDEYPNTKQKNWHHKNKKATAIYQNFTNGTP